MRGRAALALVAALAVALAGCFGAPPNSPPVVTARANVASVAVGDEVIFTGTAVDVDGSVVKFSWDFETDGTIDFLNATRGATTHRYPLPGLFTATFTAEDDLGARASMSVNVTVVARFTFSADWGSDTGFLVHAAATLLPTQIVVSATPATASAPIVFRTGEGLTAINNTTYRVALQGSALKRFESIRVEGSYNGTPSGFRVFRPVPFFGGVNDTSVIYDATIDDVRMLAGVNSTLHARGALAVEDSAGVALAHFTGTGLSTSTSGSGGYWTNSSYQLSALAWNQTISTSSGNYQTSDYAWDGTGSFSSITPSGYLRHVNLTEYRGARDNGNLTSLLQNGTGTFSQAGQNTQGTVSYTSAGSTTSTVNDGAGVPRRALRIVERFDLNGTELGSPYSETNVSEFEVAASERLVNSLIFMSWNTTGRSGTNFSSTGARFVDSDGDGSFNPDPRPDLPYDGQWFAGLAPDELQDGDAFTVRNGLGATAKLDVTAPRVEALIATGFPASPVDVLTATGNVTGAGLTGVLRVDVVASGPHAHLHMRAQTQVASATGSFTQLLVLTAKGT